MHVGCHNGRRGSFVELTDDTLRVKFGPSWDNTFPLDAIKGVARDRWPWYCGIGMRYDMRRTLGLVGSYDGIVRLSFREPNQLRVVFFVRASELVVSLEEPDMFVDDLRRRLGSRRSEQG